MTAATHPIPAKHAISADEFARQYGGDFVELVDGIVELLPVPRQGHGEICFRVAFALGTHISDKEFGRITINDSFVKTGSDPDRVRGADICFFSFERLPKGQIPEGILAVAPDMIVEVRSPSQGWDSMFKKVGEYLAVGVRAVVVVDMVSQATTVYRKDEIQQVFDNGDELTIPEVLPGFGVPVRTFFA